MSVRRREPLLPIVRLVVVLAALSACTQQQFYWGSYEDSLYERYQHPGEAGDIQAYSMLAATISEAEEAEATVAPGVYADYGYLSFKQGRTAEAVAAFQKESALFPESKKLMDTMISRIQRRQQPPTDKKPAS